MNKIKNIFFEYKYLLAVLVLIIIMVCFLNYKNSNKNSSISILSYYPNSLNYSSEITCTYPQTVRAEYFEQKVKHELPKAESNPMIFTFSEIKEDVAKLKLIDATRTISETSLIKLFENSERIVFIEGNGNTYFTMHTIYKNEGVAIYSKQVSLMGIPVSTSGMGTCIGY
jgi:hypothetical protein